MSLTENVNTKTYFEGMFGKEIQLPRELVVLFSTMTLDLSAMASRMRELPESAAQRLNQGLSVVVEEMGTVKDQILNLASVEGLVKEFGLPQSAMAVPIYQILLKILEKNEKNVANSLMRAEQAMERLKAFFTVMTTMVFDLEIEELVQTQEKEEKAISALRSDSLAQDSSRLYVVEAVRGGIDKMEATIGSARGRKAYLLAQKQRWESWVDRIFSSGKGVSRAPQEIVLYRAT